MISEIKQRLLFSYWPSKGFNDSYSVPFPFPLSDFRRSAFMITLSYLFHICSPRQLCVFVSVASGLKLSHLSVFVDLEIRLRWVQQVLNILQNCKSERLYFLSCKKESDTKNFNGMQDDLFDAQST